MIHPKRLVLSLHPSALSAGLVMYLGKRGLGWLELLFEPSGFGFDTLAFSLEPTEGFRVRGDEVGGAVNRRGRLGFSRIEDPLRLLLRAVALLVKSGEAQTAGV